MMAENDFVFLKESASEVETSGGLILSHQEKHEGKVVNGGGYKKGTVVMFAPNAPRQEVFIEGETYLVVEKKFILCIL